MECKRTWRFNKTTYLGKDDEVEDDDVDDISRKSLFGEDIEDARFMIMM